MVPQKFFFFVSADQKRCTLAFDNSPPPKEAWARAVGQDGYLLFEGQVEEPLKEIFREISGTDLVDIDIAYALSRIYLLFVFGWNTAAKRWSLSDQTFMTLDSFRQKIQTNPHQIEVQSLSGFLKQMNFDFGDRQVMKRMDFVTFLTGSFQTGFIACGRKYRHTLN